MISNESAAELLAASKDIMALMDDAELVRDISKDAAKDWEVRMLAMVRKILRFQKAIEAVEKEVANA